VKSYYVYIMASPTGTLYTGVTNDLLRRVLEHKSKSVGGFTARYNVTRLVHFEETNVVAYAIEREKEIKSWTRAKKRMLVESTNPKWKDLSEGWYS